MKNLINEIFEQNNVESYSYQVDSFKTIQATLYAKQKRLYVCFDFSGYKTSTGIETELDLISVLECLQLLIETNKGSYMSASARDAAFNYFQLKFGELYAE